MAETTQANWSLNVIKQINQKTFSLLVSGVIICALLLPVHIIGRLQHPDIKANWPKTWILGDTTYLGFRLMLLSFLPQLPDFRTTNTFMSCWYWLTSSTLPPFIILYKHPQKLRLKKFLLHSFRLCPCVIGFSCQIQINHRGSRIAVNMFFTVFVRFASVNPTQLIL